VSGWMTAATIGLALWSGILTSVMLLFTRQLGLFQLRLDRGDGSVQSDGLPIGAPAPPEVLDIVVEHHDRCDLLILDGDCSPCRNLVNELTNAVLHPRLRVLIAGPERSAVALGDRLPLATNVLYGPRVDAAMQSLELHSTPVVLSVREGQITHKAQLRDGLHLLTLLGPQGPEREPDTVGDHR